MFHDYMMETLEEGMCLPEERHATNQCIDHRIQVVKFKTKTTQHYYQPMLTEEHVILPSSILTIEGQTVIFTIYHANTQHHCTSVEL